MSEPVTRYHYDPDDVFVLMLYVEMDWDCYKCNCVFTVKTRHSIEEVDNTLIKYGWIRHVDGIKGRWICPDCHTEKSKGYSVPRTSEESFWFGCS